MHAGRTNGCVRVPEWHDRVLLLPGVAGVSRPNVGQGADGCGVRVDSLLVLCECPARLLPSTRAHRTDTAFRGRRRSSQTRA